MLLKKAMRYYRLWIYTCNFVLWLGVLMFTIAAGCVLSDPKATFLSLRMYHPTFIYAYIALVLQGGVLQFVGCVGALRLNEKWLGVYWTMMLALLVGDIVIGIIWIFLFSSLSHGLSGHLWTRLRHDYGVDKDFTLAWDNLQMDHGCCGVAGPEDFNGSHWHRILELKRRPRAEPASSPPSSSQPDSNSFTLSFTNLETSSMVPSIAPSTDRRVGSTEDNEVVLPSSFLENRTSTDTSRELKDFLRRSRRKTKPRTETISPHRESRADESLPRPGPTEPVDLDDVPDDLLWNVLLTRTSVYNKKTLERQKSKINLNSVPTSCCIHLAREAGAYLRKKKTSLQLAEPISSTNDHSSKPTVDSANVEDVLLEDSCDRTPENLLAFHHQGCIDSIHRWLEQSANLLFILGYCVIAFLKLCFLGILRYEIKEMIKKIKILNGEMVAFTDLLALGAPSTGSQTTTTTTVQQPGGSPATSLGYNMVSHHHHHHHLIGHVLTSIPRRHSCVPPYSTQRLVYKARSHPNHLNCVTSPPGCPCHATAAAALGCVPQPNPILCPSCPTDPTDPQCCRFQADRRCGPNGNNNDVEMQELTTSLL